MSLSGHEQKAKPSQLSHLGWFGLGVFIWLFILGLVFLIFFFPGGCLLFVSVFGFAFFFFTSMHCHPIHIVNVNCATVLNEMELNGNKYGTGPAVLVMTVMHTNSMVRITPMANNAN